MGRYRESRLSSNKPEWSSTHSFIELSPGKTSRLCIIGGCRGKPWKLRNRVRRREETLRELAEDIERLARLAHPGAPIEVLETLTKDQFIDALNHDESRLRVAQARPTSLRAELGMLWILSRLAWQHVESVGNHCT